MIWISICQVCNLIPLLTDMQQNWSKKFLLEFKGLLISYGWKFLYFTSLIFLKVTCYYYTIPYKIPNIHEWNFNILQKMNKISQLVHQAHWIISQNMHYQNMFLLALFSYEKDKIYGFIIYTLEQHSKMSTYSMPHPTKQMDFSQMLTLEIREEWWIWLWRFW